jgi:hypothetical protein
VGGETLRTPAVQADPNNPQSIIDMVTEVTGVVDRNIEFGEPLDPNDPGSTTLAGGTGAGAHNGTPGNIFGSWVELEVGGQGAELNTPLVCRHNLFLDDPEYAVPVAGSPNVRWSVWGWQHDNATRTLWDALDVSTPQLGSVAAKQPTRGGLGVAPFDTLELYWFKPDVVASEDEVYYTVMLPGGWKVGTDIIPMVHWTPDVSAGGANECVRWGLEHSWADVGDAYPASTTIYTDATDDSTQTTQGTQLVAGIHYTSQFAALSSTGFLPYSVLVFRLFRNSSHATDTSANNAGLLDFTLQYQADGVGSDEMLTKTADLELEWSPFNIKYEAGDIINANDIELRCYAAPWMAVDPSHKLKVTLFFIRASR